MLNYLWAPLVPHLTIVGLIFDLVGIIIILLENFLPTISNKIDDWLSEITYVGFTERLERPLFLTYSAFYQYFFIPVFIYFVIAVFYDFELVQTIIKDKWDFIEVILVFMTYFMGYMMTLLLFIWWILPLLFTFSSKIIYKYKPLSGVGFMLIIIGICLNVPQALQ